jgi:hypothetical protein
MFSSGQEPRAFSTFASPRAVSFYNGARRYKKPNTMQSVNALISTLRGTSIVLNDVQFQAKVMNDMSSTINDKLLYAKKTLERKVNVLKGGKLHPEAALAIESQMHPDAALLHAVFEVLRVWPLISAKTVDIVDSSESCIAQANQAKVIADGLVVVLTEAEAANDYSNVDRVQLTAFNSDMAQLVERTAVLEFLTASHVEDMKDAMEILRNVRGLVQQVADTMDKQVIESMDHLLSSTWDFAKLSGKIYTLVKTLPTAQLAHPAALEIPTASEIKQDAAERLRNAAENLARMRQ